MLEADDQQPSSSGEESVPAMKARLENRVLQLTREKKELILKNHGLRLKVAHYEEYTQRLCSVLRKLKGPIDVLSSQSALITEALSCSYEIENVKQDQDDATELPEPHIEKKMKTASVVPMVRGFPIRRIMIPLQRLNLNAHRHRPNRIRGHRREAWWHEAQPHPQEPLPEVLRPDPRGPARRLRRVERRRHRVVRPRARPPVRDNSRRRQESAVGERASVQNRRAGSSHQMLQAVVLLQRLSLSQHQQHQQRVQQLPPALPPDNLLSPVVMLQDISTTMQPINKTSWKLMDPMKAKIGVAHLEVDSNAGPSTEPEVKGNEIPINEDPRPSLTVQQEESQLDSALSQFVSPVDSEHAAQSDEQLEFASETEVSSTKSILSETDDHQSTSLQLTVNTLDVNTLDVPCEIAVIQSDLTLPQRNDTMDTQNQLEVLPQEPQEEPSADVGAESSESETVIHFTATPMKQNEVEPPAAASTSSGSRKRKASPYAEKSDTCSISAEDEVEDRGQSSPITTDQGCRPRRRCAIRKNYALLFAGWNAD